MKKLVVLAAAFVLIAGTVPAFALTMDLTGTIRDFNDTHLDFEANITGLDTGIVQTTLGADGKPVYTGMAGNPSTHGLTAFDQWYRDVAGVNLSKSYTITLDNTITADPNVYTFIDDTFFPIDGELLGNQGRTHNYHFTYEIHSSFTYQGGEFFSFAGDDDLWVFINDQLVIDLGGVHTVLTGSIDLDALGLTLGEDYDIDIFFAERHTTQSNFRIDTSILLNEPPDVPEPASLLVVATGLLGLFLRKRMF